MIKKVKAKIKKEVVNSVPFIQIYFLEPVSIFWNLKELKLFKKLNNLKGIVIFSKLPLLEALETELIIHENNFFLKLPLD
ncbi:MAG: hypothetical protein QW068_04585, partial [Thermoplasmata archaeon]